eukprot:3075292-Rhodomonas_salina.2
MPNNSAPGIKYKLLAPYCALDLKWFEVVFAVLLQMYLLTCLLCRIRNSQQTTQPAVNPAMACAVLA